MPASWVEERLRLGSGKSMLGLPTHVQNGRFLPQVGPAGAQGGAPFKRGLLSRLPVFLEQVLFRVFFTLFAVQHGMGCNQYSCSTESCSHQHGGGIQHSLRGVARRLAILAASRSSGWLIRSVWGCPGRITRSGLRWDSAFSPA